MGVTVTVLIIPHGLVHVFVDSLVFFLFQVVAIDDFPVCREFCVLHITPIRGIAQFVRGHILHHGVVRRYRHLVKSQDKNVRRFLQRLYFHNLHIAGGFFLFQQDNVLGITGRDHLLIAFAFYFPFPPHLCHAPVIFQGVLPLAFNESRVGVLPLQLVFQKLLHLFGLFVVVDFDRPYIHRVVRA